jgi:alpha-beta hydrolase superfamily lysophospholipase
MSRARSLALTVAGLLTGGIALMLLPKPYPTLEPKPWPRVEDVDAWVAAKVAAGEAAGVWPQASERLVRNVDGQAKVAFLYVHGFGATRGEGELVVDQLASEWGANALYIRLPGHGIDKDAHAAAQPQDYVDVVAEALHAMPALGERVVVVGSSTGGLVATWAAAEYPDRVDALLLTSPFYALHSAVDMHLLRSLGGPILLRAAFGEDRYAGWGDDPEHRKVDGYEDHWLIEQRYAALFPLDALRGAIARPEVYARVTQPVGMLAYYRDEAHQDAVVSVAAMRAAFGAMNHGSPRPESAFTPIADGNHILTSAYVRTDKAAVLGAARAFLTASIGPPPAPEPDAATAAAGP